MAGFGRPTSSSPNAALPSASRGPGRIGPVVILFGTIVREQDSRILFRVSPKLGDAAACGFPALNAQGPSEFWIAKRQCTIREAQVRGEHDQLEMSAELASQKAQVLVQGGC